MRKLILVTLALAFVTVAAASPPDDKKIEYPSWVSIPKGAKIAPPRNPTDNQLVGWTGAIRFSRSYSAPASGSEEATIEVSPDGIGHITAKVNITSVNGKYTIEGKSEDYVHIDIACLDNSWAKDLAMCQWGHWFLHDDKRIEKESRQEKMKINVNCKVTPSDGGVPFSMTRDVLQSPKHGIQYINGFFVLGNNKPIASAGLTHFITQSIGGPALTPVGIPLGPMTRLLTDYQVSVSPVFTNTREGSVTSERSDAPGVSGSHPATETCSWRVTHVSGPELNIFGDYKPEPSYTTDAEIVKGVKAGLWFPSSIEMKEFAASGHGEVVGAVDNVWPVLCAIQRHKPARVNIFCHANNTGFFGLSGQCQKGDVEFNTGGKRYQYSQLNAETIQLAEQDGFSFSDGKSKGVTLAMVRDALPKGAKLFIYACHSGEAKDELNKLSRLLNVKVYGFTREIRFYPIDNVYGRPTKIQGWVYSVGDGKTVKDFHELQPDRESD